MDLPLVAPQEPVMPPVGHHSTSREKLVEHLFIGELLRSLWARGRRDVEVLRVEVDGFGYDLVVECNGVMRHIQLKSSGLKGATRRQDINIALSRKPSGCVVWIRFDDASMQPAGYHWLGGAPGTPLPPLGERVGKHSRKKLTRSSIRVVPQASFEAIATMDTLVERLFGPV